MSTYKYNREAIKPLLQTLINDCRLALSDNGNGIQTIDRERPYALIFEYYYNGTYELWYDHGRIPVTKTAYRLALKLGIKNRVPVFLYEQHPYE